MSIDDILSQKIRAAITALAAFTMLVGCQNELPKIITADKGHRIVLPLVQGWHEGSKVYYLTTDVSDYGMAQKLGVNFVPRLLDGLPSYPKPPGLKTVLERIYVFPDGEQGSILPSTPKPLGAGNQDVHYSPLWLLYEVQWQPEAIPVLLTSEEDLLAAEDAGKLLIERTNIIVNCPVVQDDSGHSLGTPLIGQDTKSAF